VPLRISHDPQLAAEARPMTEKPEFRTNRGSVDSELSLLAAGNYNINAFVRNPIFLNERPGSFDQAQLVKVTRLDGPAATDVIALIDRTISAERHGLLGRAYVDVRGPHKQGERWLEAVARQLDELHFDPEVRLQPGTFPAGVRFDAPALYFGWYARHLNGPFTLPNFRLAPGARPCARPPPAGAVRWWRAARRSPAVRCLSPTWSSCTSRNCCCACWRAAIIWAMPPTTRSRRSVGRTS
jgi:uncharacterized protein (TIGR03790 family)